MIKFPINESSKSKMARFGKLLMPFVDKAASFCRHIKHVNDHQLDDHVASSQRELQYLSAFYHI